MSWMQSAETTSQPATRGGAADHTCWWCDAPIGEERERILNARDRRLTVHARCVPLVIHDGRIAGYLCAGIVQLDAEEI